MFQIEYGSQVRKALRIGTERRVRIKVVVARLGPQASACLVMVAVAG